MKKSILFILLVGMVGLFLPKEVFAADFTLKSISEIDYRFFIEDQDENDIENLKFKLYDVNNLISYESGYNSNTKAYYFINGVFGAATPPSPEAIDKSILPEYLSEELGKLDSNDVNNDWYSIARELTQKYSGLDFCYGNLQFYIPMVLEEENHVGDGEPLKKVVFALGLIMPGDPSNSEFVLHITLVNNSCVYKDSYNGAPDHIVDSLINMLSLTRNQTFDYSDEVIEQFSTGTIASNEVKGNEYLNKGFLNDKFATSEISSNELGSKMNYFADDARVVQMRNSSDNLQEEVLKDYCDCLPVFVQARKAPNVVDIITNPETWNNGMIVLGIIMLGVVGTSMVVISRKKSNS